MNRIVMFFAGLLLMCSMSGCCLMHGYGGYGAGYGGGGCAPCGGCNTGCGVGARPGGYPSAYAPIGGQTAFAPGYPTTALVDPLPTY